MVRSVISIIGGRGGKAQSGKMKAESAAADVNRGPVLGLFATLHFRVAALRLLFLLLVVCIIVADEAMDDWLDEPVAFGKVEKDEFPCFRDESARFPPVHDGEFQRVPLALLACE